jgi:hypothetical protein
VRDKNVYTREGRMRIACSDCEMYQTSHCEDCLVTAMLHPPEDGVLDIDEELDESLGTLAGAGLIPVLKFRPRSEPEDQEGDGRVAAS